MSCVSYAKRRLSCAYTRTPRRNTRPYAVTITRDRHTDECGDERVEKREERADIARNLSVSSRRSPGWSCIGRDWGHIRKKASTLYSLLEPAKNIDIRAVPASKKENIDECTIDDGSKYRESKEIVLFSRFNFTCVNTRYAFL